MRHNFLNTCLLFTAILSFSIVVTFILSIGLVYLFILGHLISVDNISAAMHDYINIINYLLNPFVESLTIKHYTLSTTGYIHFADVKHLLMWIEIIMLVTVGSESYIVYKLRQKQQLWSLRSCLYVLLWIGMPIAFSLAANFNSLFIAFHKLIFRNDYWIFDPVKDSVIQLMPENLFMAGSILLLALYELISYMMYRRCK